MSGSIERFERHAVPLGVFAVVAVAVLVTRCTLPFLSAGVASVATPENGSDAPHSLSAGCVLRHPLPGSRGF